MSNNVAYHGTMQLDDLEIGQTLIAVQHGRWSNPTHTEEPWEVIKKTKTRLVITMLREVEGAMVRTQVHERVVVREGKVTSKLEGRSSSYDGLALYTEDDERLAEVRAETARSQIFLRARSQAESAYKNLTKETAARAITALQAFLDAPEEAS